MRIRLALLTLLVLLLGVLRAGAQDVTPAPGADVSFDLLVLVADEPVQAEFADTVTMHMYAFVGTEGDEITLYAAPTDDSAGLDTILFLLGASGEVFAYNDDDASGNSDLPFLSSRIADFELPYTGVYLVLAGRVDDYVDSTDTLNNPLSDPQPYEIALTGASTPDGGDFIGLTGEVFDTDADGTTDNDVTLTFDDEIQFGLVFFYADEGQVIGITTSAADSDTPVVDTMLYLFDTRGQRVVSVDDTADGTYAALELDAPASGVYVALVAPYAFWAAADGETITGDVFVAVLVE